MNFRGNDDPFPSQARAMQYAVDAGFTVSVNVGSGTATASRDDMDSTFTLIETGENEWRWTRPFTSFSNR